MTDIVKLCPLADVEEEKPVRVTPEQFPPLAVFVLDGEYFVTDDTCTHSVASLCDGYQEGDEIECPFHGGAFNIKTGEAIAFPCTQPIKVYKVVIEDDYVCIESPAAA